MTVATIPTILGSETKGITRDMTYNFIHEKGEAGATCYEVARHYGIDQGLISNHFTDMRSGGKVIRTGERRRTTGNATAAVHISKSFLDKTSKSFRSISQEFSNLFVSSTHDVALIKITAAMASHIHKYRTNDNNRNITKGNMRDLTEAMRDGNFNPNSTIQFSTDGILIEGHHRILAQVKTNTDQVYVVQIGCKYDWVNTVDVGKRRTGIDAVTMHLKNRGWTVSKDDVNYLKLAAAQMINFVGNGLKQEHNRMSDPSNADLCRYIDDNKAKLEASLNTYKALRAECGDFDEACSGSFKKLVQSLTHEMFSMDEEFTYEYITAVFGRNSDGVFSGKTPESVKDIYRQCRERTQDIKSHREAVLSAAYVNGFNLLRAYNGGKIKTESVMNLPATSNRLVKIERTTTGKRKVVNVTRVK